MSSSSCRRPSIALAAHQGRQGAAAGGVERHARQGAARRADLQGARLRSRILFLGRHFRAQRHAGADRQDAARRRSTRPRTASSSSTRWTISARSSPTWTSRVRASSGPPTPSAWKTRSSRSAACIRQSDGMNRPRSDGFPRSAGRGKHDAARRSRGGRAFSSPSACWSSRSAAICRSARLSMPGAGFLPKILAVLTILFGADAGAARRRKQAVRRPWPGATSSTPRWWC